MLILAALLCLLAAFGKGVTLPEDRYDADELLYIYYAGLFDAFFISRDMGNIVWHSGVKYLALPVGAYVLGAMVYVSPQRDMLKAPQRIYAFSSPDGVPRPIAESLTELAQHPFPYAREMIDVLRQRMLGFRAASLFFVCLLGFLLGGYLCALCAAGVFFQDSLFLWFSSVVLLESLWLSLHLLNMLLILMCLVRWQGGCARGTVWKYAAAVGVVTGLLSGTKIHGALDLVTWCILACGIVVLRGRDSRGLRREAVTAAVATMLIFAVSFFVFAVFNPLFYTEDPLTVLRGIVRARFDLFNAQAAGDVFSDLTTPWKRLFFVVHRFLVVELDPPEIMAAVFGGGFMAWRAGSGLFRGRELGVEALLLTAFTVEIAAILLFMRYAGVRYLVVLTPYLGLFQGYGWYCIITRFFGMVRARVRYR